MSGTGTWWLRLLLAGLLVFGSEVLLWTNPTGRSLTEWVLALPGYFILATFLLDTLARYRVRDLPGLMALAGIYGLLNALLINPDSTLFDVPRTLVTRVSGAHTLLGLEMLVFFLALTAGHLRYLRRILLAGAVIVGLAWGTWVRWSALEADVAYETPSLEVMLLVGLIGIVLLLLLIWQCYRSARSLSPESILLNAREWLLIGIAAGGLLLFRIAQSYVDFPTLFLTAILLSLCAAMLWFRRETRLQPLIEHMLPVRPLRWAWILLSFAILVWAGVFSYSLPFAGTRDFNNLSFVVYGFTLYGLAWLPAVSLWVGLRSYIRQVQARPL
jgi:hypothetical protein